VKRYKSTTILGGGPPGKIVQCQSFNLNPFLVEDRSNLSSTSCVPYQEKFAK
jgi:hypothetical protein